MKTKKVAVAMSGGVDSGVAAALLVKEGYNCTAFHMHLWHETGGDFENKCCSTESLEAARKTAHLLGIPFYTINFADIFKKRVVDYFLKAYASGLTPNPCIVCNKYIKFGELLDYVRKLGFDYLATGHYAKVISDKQYHLLQSNDAKKDQTYFLYNLTQKQLAHVFFPVGDYLKTDVVEMARKMRLPVAHRPESQEICFFPENDYREFLKRQIPKKLIPGEVVDLKGEVIGRHYGLPLYTIGQRHGYLLDSKFKIPALPAGRQNSKIIPPYYVIDKDIKKNQLVVGFGKETERKEFWVGNICWTDPNFQFSIFNFQLFVKIRHQGELLKCKVQSAKFKIKVTLFEPERGITPGQSAVFYCGDEVLGGGIIDIDRS